MRPRIRKKDKDTQGNQRYVLEWSEKGQIRTFGFKPSKLLDYLKKSKIIGENTS